MSARPRKHLFVSYSSRDHAESPELLERIFLYVRGLEKSRNDAFSIEVFIDQDRLQAGDLWEAGIERALDHADVALLLVSPHFLASDFIMGTEFPRLLERHRNDRIPLVPVMLHRCAPENNHRWFAQAQWHPRGPGVLSLVPARAELDAILTQLTRHLYAILEGRAGAPSPASAPAPAAPPAARGIAHEADGEAAGGMPDGMPGGTPDAAPGAAPDDPAARLLAAALFEELGEAESRALAARLVAGIAQLTRAEGDALFRAVRFCIEFQLLMADDPVAPAALQHFLGAPVDDASAKRLLKELRERAPTGDFARTPVRVNSYFFAFTREREALWKRYFDAVLEEAGGEADRQRLASLCAIQVQYGFLAPQHLVAGLLSRFNDDWRPVLNAYQSAVPDPRHRPGAFESLQASQWNCWLVWGPSIPICSCPQWRGVYAHQYGYGDENNSLPVIDLSGTEGRPRLLDPIAAAFDAEGRGAKWVQLTGRLRWAPWFLRAAGEQDADDASDDHFDLAAADEIDAPPASSRWPAAPAQANLYRDDGLAFRHDSDGIALQVDGVDRLSNDHRVYFSAYLWMMFLVATAGEEPGLGPALLRGKAYPRPDAPGRRDAKLWQHLLPAFVHANVADPAALEFQKRVLAHNAMALLHQVWLRRAELFEADDLRAGLRFHLASASDFSGCGCAVRYPSGTPLVALMRERLEAEPDREFAAAVVLPGCTGDDPGRPRGLAEHFASCRLPELVADYFDSVKPRK